MKRGVLFVTWDNPDYLAKTEETALKVAEHLKLPVAIATNMQVKAKENIHYLPCEFPEFPIAMKRQKSLIAELTPFEQTLYLDSDVTIVDARLDFAWRTLERPGGLAMAIGKALVGGNRFKKNGLDPDATYYNTGVIFFDRNKVATLFAEWKSLCLSSTLNVSDEYILSALLYKENYPIATLPPVWNLRTTEAYHLRKNIKFWHSSEPLPKELESRKTSS